MNGLREESEPEAVRPNAGDYFVVSAENCSWWVSTEMARHIEAMLDAQPRVEWVTFVDLSGSRVRLSVRQVEFIGQSTADQRAYDREFSRMLSRERKADRSWDEDK